LVYANKPFVWIMEFYLEISFIFENMFPIGLKPCCEFYKIYEIGLNWFEAFMQI
jgi:hypothetical protein